MVKKLFKTLVFEWRLRRATKKATRHAARYGKKYLVIVFDGKPVAVSMQGIKNLIRQRRFVKSFTSAEAMKRAIYVAYPKNRRPCF